MDDQQILAIIGESFDGIGPTPPDALQAAMAAFEFRDLDAQLAELTFDSWSTEPAVAMRGTATETRMLSYEIGETTLDIELQADGTTIIGQIDPAPNTPIEIESPSSAVVTVTTDALGRFRLAPAPRGALRLRVGTNVKTPWIIR